MAEQPRVYTLVECGEARQEGKFWPAVVGYYGTESFLQNAVPLPEAMGRIAEHAGVEWPDTAALERRVADLKDKLSAASQHKDHWWKRSEEQARRAKALKKRVADLQERLGNCEERIQVGKLAADYASEAFLLAGCEPDEDYKVFAERIKAQIEHLKRREAALKRRVAELKERLVIAKSEAAGARMRADSRDGRVRKLEAGVERLKGCERVVDLLNAPWLRAVAEALPSQCGGSARDLRAVADALDALGGEQGEPEPEPEPEPERVECWKVVRVLDDGRRVSAFQGTVLAAPDLGPRIEYHEGETVPRCVAFADRKEAERWVEHAACWEPCDLAELWWGTGILGGALRRGRTFHDVRLIECVGRYRNGQAISIDEGTEPESEPERVECWKVVRVTEGGVLQSAFHGHDDDDLKPVTYQVGASVALCIAFDDRAAAMAFAKAHNGCGIGLRVHRATAAHLGPAPEALLPAEDQFRQHAMSAYDLTLHEQVWPAEPRFKVGDRVFAMGPKVDKTGTVKAIIGCGDAAYLYDVQLDGEVRRTAHAESSLLPLARADPRDLVVQAAREYRRTQTLNTTLRDAGIYHTCWVRLIEAVDRYEEAH